MPMEEKKKKDTKTTTSVFDETEQECIRALRDTLSPDYDNEEEPFSHYLHDTTLWRYLKARDFDVAAAKTMFVESVAWKKSFCLHKAQDEYAAQETRWSRLSQRVHFAGLLPPHVQTTTGGPVAIERVGKIDFKGLYRHEEVFQATMRGHCCYLEDIFQRLQGTQYRGTKTRALVIADCTGISMSLLWYTKTLQRLFTVGLSYFPELTSKVLLVNAPSVITGIWAAVSKLLPAATKAKVQILGTNCSDRVAAELQHGLQDLPDFLGGTVHYEDTDLARAGTATAALAEVKKMEEEEIQTE